MTYKLKVPTRIIGDSVKLALSKPAKSRGDFFHEIREAFKRNLEALLIAQGISVKPDETLGYTNYLRSGTHNEWNPIVKQTGSGGRVRQELDLQFCAKYGHDDYSLSAINYLDRCSASLPALSSLAGVFSIGNILVLVENKDCQLHIQLGEGVNSTGYAYHISKRKRKSFLCLFGISFEPHLINAVIDARLACHQESAEELDEVRLGTISYPVIFIDRVSGDLYTCSCFDGHFSTSHDIERLLPYGTSERKLRAKAQSIRSMNGICHLCNGRVPKRTYGHSMYFSSFLQKFLPYHNLLSRIHYGKQTFEGAEFRHIENMLRERFGYPKVGQQWVKETILFKMVCELFPSYKVVHHYRGTELEGLELDVWLPELRLGIEYQGEQHYKIVKPWGGKRGLEKRIANDKKKRALCRRLGYRLVEIRYSEELSHQMVKQRVTQALRKHSGPIA